MCAGQPCGQEVDWWALGIMMYAMMAGMFPFIDSDECSLQFKIRCHEVMYPMWISEEAKLIMRRVSIINIKTEALLVLQ
jgi:serine/threonine protein kinase